MVGPSVSIVFLVWLIGLSVPETDGDIVICCDIHFDSGVWYMRGEEECELSGFEILADENCLNSCHQWTFCGRRRW